MHIQKELKYPIYFKGVVIATPFVELKNKETPVAMSD